MAFFDWADQYSIGVLSIDQQHQKLFELISHFYDLIHQKDVKRAMSETLKGLIEYTVYHFATEEGYMQKYQYPLYAGHVAQHAKFVEKAKDIQTRFQAGELVIPIEIADFLKEWLTNHVLREDQKLGPFLRDNGMS
jgi:hemerythrin